ncbi:uncharacterized protein Tco025E_02253 [Trypanosoma conorhini]|uniref:Uncharacterized protein n=1 Tax=Trypanosoma conorhini TaxID=83891 RepID=A0A3R7PUZ7_9TRYP|nr:uncharacterized protein Tco025E_02253 [Trypanosoma conorhini]RNF25573.1 hypothetical protein Tco025E_02253 [Trypanosoma conorhini]
MEVCSDKKDDGGGGGNSSSGIPHSVQRELRAVIEEKTTLSLRLGELQREVERLRAEKGGGGAVGEAGLAVCQCRSLERENKMLRAQLLREIAGTQPLRRTEGKVTAPPSSSPETAGGIDSVRLPSEGLLRTVRAAFEPGSFAVDEGTAVTVEYNHDFLVVRGPRASRDAFMARLLHTVLRYMEGAPQRGFGASGDAAAAAAAADERRPLHLLRRALESEQVAREQATVAQRGAEEACALQQATLSLERAQHTEERRQLEGRVRQLEAALRRERDKLHVPLRRLEANDPQTRNAGGDRRADAVPAASPQRGGDPPAMALQPERNAASATKGSGAPDQSPAGGIPPRGHACGATTQPLQREVELLRDEKYRLSQQLQHRVEVVEQLRHQLREAEAATAHLCRGVLSSSEVAAMIIRGAAAAPYLVLHRSGGVDEHQVRGLVQALSEGSGGAPPAGAARPVEQRLADAAALLEIEHRAWKEALAFAMDERDAALQAQREAALLARPGAAVAPPPPVLSSSAAAAAEVLEKENVELRIELQRCFEDMRRLADSIARSQAMYQAAQEKLRAGERRMHEKEQTSRCLRQRQDAALMAALERERSLELQLQRLRQKSKWGATQPPSAAAAVVHAEPKVAALAHLVSTPSKKSCAASGVTLSDSRNYQQGQHQNNADTQECSFISRSNGPQSGPSTATTPLRGTGAAGTATLSSPSAPLRKENFEGALHAIHPA